MAAVLLAGCATPEQRAKEAAAAAEANRAYIFHMVHTVWGPQCAGMGFKPGSDGFATCVFRLHDQDQAVRAAQAQRDAANAEAAAQALRGFGQAIQRQPVQPPPFPSSTYTRCAPTPQGGLNCHSY